MSYFNIFSGEFIYVCRFFYSNGSSCYVTVEVVGCGNGDGSETFYGYFTVCIGCTGNGDVFYSVAVIFE